MLNCKKLGERAVKKGFFIYLTINIVAILCCSCNNNTDIQKLESLKKTFLDTVESAEAPKYLYQLLNEAEQQGNERYQGTAYYFLARHHYTTNMDSTSYYLQEAKTHYQKAGYQRGVALAMIAEIYYMSFEGNNELAIENIFSLLKDISKYNDNFITTLIYTQLGKLYINSRMPKEALNAYENGICTYEGLDESDKDLEVYQQLIQGQAIACNHMKDFEQSMYYSNIYRDIIIARNLPDYQRERLLYIADAIDAYSLLEMDSIKTVETILAKMEVFWEEYSKATSLPNSEDILYNANYNGLLADYYRRKHDYTKAFEHAQAIDLKYLNNPQDYTTIRALKAEILLDMGNYKEALAIENQVAQYLDSLNRASFTRQINEVESILKKDKLTQENDLKMKYSRLIIASLSIFCILLIVITYTRIRGYRKLRKKSQIIFSQYRNIDKQLEKIAANINEYDQETEKTADLKTQSAEREITLFEKIESYLKNSQSYCKPDLSREALATELNTNRQYLTQAIQEAKGMTFMEYINDLRLEHARQLLCYNSELSIDEVYLLSGFNSKSTFYRLIKDKFDLTPLEIREICSIEQQVG